MHLKITLESPDSSLILSSGSSGRHLFFILKCYCDCKTIVEVLLSFLPLTEMILLDKKDSIRISFVGWMSTIILNTM